MPSRKSAKTAAKSSPPSGDTTFASFFSTLNHSSAQNMAVFSLDERQQEIMKCVTKAVTLQSLAFKGIELRTTLLKTEPLAEHEAAVARIQMHRRLPKGLDELYDLSWEVYQRQARSRPGDEQPDTYEKPPRLESSATFCASCIFGNVNAPLYRRVLFSMSENLLVPITDADAHADLTPLLTSTKKPNIPSMMQSNINGGVGGCPGKLEFYPRDGPKKYPSFAKLWARGRRIKRLTEEFYLVPVLLPYLDNASRCAIYGTCKSLRQLSASFYPMNQLSFGVGLTKGVETSRILRNDLVLCLDIALRARCIKIEATAEIDEAVLRKPGVELFSKHLRHLFTSLSDSTTSAQLSAALPGWASVLRNCRYDAKPGGSLAEDAAHFLGPFKNPDMHKPWNKQAKPVQLVASTLAWLMVVLASNQKAQLLEPVPFFSHQVALPDHICNAFTKVMKHSCGGDTSRAFHPVSGCGRLLFVSSEHTEKKNDSPYLKRWLCFADTDGFITRIDTLPKRARLYAQRTPSLFLLFSILLLKNTLPMEQTKICKTFGYEPSDSVDVVQRGVGLYDEMFNFLSRNPFKISPSKVVPKKKAKTALKVTIPKSSVAGLAVNALSTATAAQEPLSAPS